MKSKKIMSWIGYHKYYLHVSAWEVFKLRSIPPSPFYGPYRGHPYDCFPTDSNYNIFAYAKYATMHCIRS